MTPDEALQTLEAAYGREVTEQLSLVKEERRRAADAGTYTIVILMLVLTTIFAGIIAFLFLWKGR